MTFAVARTINPKISFFSLLPRWRPRTAATSARWRRWRRWMWWWRTATPRAAGCGRAAARRTTTWPSSSPWSPSPSRSRSQSWPPSASSAGGCWGFILFLFFLLFFHKHNRVELRLWPRILNHSLFMPKTSPPRYCRKSFQNASFLTIFYQRFFLTLWLPADRIFGRYEIQINDVFSFKMHWFLWRL